MTVRKIIGNKQIRGTVTVLPTDTVASAAEMLAKHRIGAVIVTRDGGAVIDGILSERDIVRCLGLEGPSSLQKKVSEIMTAEVIGCRPDDTANSVMEKMTDGRFRHMPVIEDGKMIGVISIGDVVKARIDEIQHENEALTDMITNTW
jgi:CBS domain-containing protein